MEYLKVAYEPPAGLLDKTRRHLAGHTLDVKVRTQAFEDIHDHVQILIQPQSSPMKVEEEVAIIYCGVNNLLRKLQTNQIADFQTKYINRLNDDHADIMAQIKEGKYTDEITKVLSEEAEKIVNSMIVKQ